MKPAKRDRSGGLSTKASALFKTAVGEKALKDSFAPNRIGSFPHEDERVFFIHE
jgi:hypothetical protein